MEFLKAMIGDISEGMDHSDDVFEAALTASEECKNLLVKHTQKYVKKGEYFNASLFLFTAAWALVGHFNRGVNHTVKKSDKGERNMVSRLWHLLRIAFYSGDTTKALAKLKTFDKDFEGGKFDEI